MPEFQVFRKRMVPLTKVPYVTIQKRGAFSFNAASYSALGSPEAVELLFDPAEKVIGVRAVDPKVEHAYPVRVGNGKDKVVGRTFVISGTAFTKYWAIDTSVSRRWRATVDDGILCFDLKEPGTEVTSNRRARSQNGNHPESTADAASGTGFDRLIGQGGLATWEEDLQR